jgi:catechol 2,3-dioxygenase-like lactoylglutathione lyase family enzyme
MFRAITFALCLSATIGATLQADTTSDTVVVGKIPRLWGVWLPVDDMDQAIRFYQDGCGLKIASRDYYPRTVSFHFEDYYLICYLVDTLPAQQSMKESMLEVNFSSRSIPDGIDSLRFFGAILHDTVSRESGIGGTVHFRDPFGTVGNLIKVESFPTLKAIDVYNIGVQVHNMSAARLFYVDLLGIPVLTERYYPPTVPLGGPSGGFTFALHDLATIPATDVPFDRARRLILEVANLDTLKAVLIGKGITPLSQVTGSTTYGKRIVLKDPSGNFVEIIQSRSSAFDRRPRKILLNTDATMKK